MAYPYPQKNKYLLFHKREDGRYQIKNVLEEENWLMDEQDARFLLQLDGKTDPFQIEGDLTREEREILLQAFEENDFLEEFGRIKMLGIGTAILTLGIPRHTKKGRRLARRINRWVLILWLPVFLAGCGTFLFTKRGIRTETGIWQLIAGYLLGTLSALGLHEVGHLCAVLGYGGQVFEYGVMVSHFLPGAFVAMGEEEIKGRWKRIQVSVAGIEVNFLLAGCFLFLAFFFPAYKTMFYLSAVINFLMAVTNTTLASGMDGLKILSLLMGTDDLWELAEYTIRESMRTKRIKSGEGCGIMTAAFWLLSLFQLAFPLMLALMLFYILEV